MRPSCAWSMRPSGHPHSSLKRQDVHQDGVLCGLWVLESAQAFPSRTRCGLPGQWAGKLTPFCSLSGREWGRVQAWGHLGRLDSVSRTVLEVSEGAAGQRGPVGIGENHPSGRGMSHLALSMRNVQV